MTSKIQTLQIPSHYKLTYSKVQIREAVRRMADEISPWLAETYKQTGQDVIALPVMRGGIFFYCDLAKRLQASVELKIVRTWGYTPGTYEVNKEIQMDLSDVNPEGRSILLVDDICDSGRTLKELQSALLKGGAKSVRSAVLIRRLIEPMTYEPEYCGFEFLGPDWFVGYGMEDSERWRNLPDIYTIKNDK